MSLLKQFFTKFVLGMAHGAGFLSVFGILGVAIVFFQPELRAKVSNRIFPSNQVSSNTELSSYVVKDKVPNPKASLISGRNQITVPADYRRVSVDSEQALYEILESTNGNVAIFLADGVYDLHSTIVLDKPNVMLLSQAGNKETVIFNGKGMRRSHRVENLIEITSSGAVIDGITMQNAGNHIIQIRSEANADFPVIRNCTIRDGYEQLIKVSYDKRNKPYNYSDSGIIENCLFEYTAGIGPNYYIGGIDAHGVRNWVIKNNVFKHIASPGNRIAEHAIHLWNNTENNVVEGNVIIDSDRGIGFGMWKKASGDENKNIRFSNYGGIIRNNFIYHSDNGNPFADTGIILENSPRTLVENNVIYMEHPYRRAIEYRFPQTEEVTIKNNFTNKSISSRNGGKAELENNVEALQKTEFLLKAHQFSLENNLDFTF